MGVKPGGPIAVTSGVPAGLPNGRIGMVGSGLDVEEGPPVEPGRPDGSGRLEPIGRIPLPLLLLLPPAPNIDAMTADVSPGTIAKLVSSDGCWVTAGVSPAARVAT